MITQLDKKIINRLGKNLPLCSRPFEKIAREIDIEEEALFNKIREYQARGWIRKFSAGLNHTSFEIASTNAMGVWKVPENRIQKVGRVMASFREVSHCYERATHQGWKYNLYTMIHASSKEECERVARRISQKTGIREYELLYTSQEFKKTSPIYFEEELSLQTK
ncbi:MAG: Lrp/AsnC family transcriptional regulator [bacterium]